jgi:putative ABC transport system substrate-binding protein
MNRRDFITLLGGAAAWPLVARAQQSGPMRRIGVLMYLAADDPDSPARVAAFAQGLQELGWINGRNIRIDYLGRGQHRSLPRLCGRTGRAGAGCHLGQ